MIVKGFDTSAPVAKSYVVIVSTFVTATMIPHNGARYNTDTFLYAPYKKIASATIIPIIPNAIIFPP